MMDLFPWEEPEPRRATETARQRHDEPGGEPANEADTASPAPSATVHDPAQQDLPGVVAGAGDEEPPAVEPEIQPDGDPRERKETGDDVADREPPAPTEIPAQPRPQPETATPRHGDPLRPPARDRPVARKEYYSIGEVSELVGLPAHVLRYWESQFTVLNPSKNRSGNRAYQRKEIRLILLVKHLLYEEKYTVEGAKAKLDQLRRGGSLPERTAAALDAQAVRLLREDLNELRGLIAEVV